MSDDLKIVRPEDPSKINVNQPWEVDYWCKVLGCTPEQLRKAVKAVGTSVDAVKRYLI